jgi:glucose-6-phosphate 1-dehydrogenase
MHEINDPAEPSDALVLFGATGDLAYKKIFPALYALVKKGFLNVPVVGVASSPWSLEQLRERITKAVNPSGPADNPDALNHLLSLFRYVRGDYNPSLRT